MRLRYARSKHTLSDVRIAAPQSSEHALMAANGLLHPGLDVAAPTIGRCLHPSIGAVNERWYIAEHTVILASDRCLPPPATQR